MTRANGGPLAVELDALGLAVGLAIVTGGLSLLAPFLVALVEALAALAVASWAMVVAEDRAAGPAPRSRRRAMALAILVLGASGFLLAPSAAAPFRGILLALTLVPLWAVERRARRSSPGRTESE